MLKYAIKFEGTVAELVEWAQTTFANTGTIRIRGSIHLPEIRDRPDRIDLLTMRDDATGVEVLLPDTVDAVLSLGVPAWARMSLGAEPEPAEAPKPAEPVEGDGGAK